MLIQKLTPGKMVYNQQKSKAVNLAFLVLKNICATSPPVMHKNKTYHQQ